VEKPIDQAMMELLSELQKQHKTRGMALALTKVEEALFWYRQHEEEQRKALKASGVGIS